MKFRHLLLSLLAVAAFSATSCQEEEKDLGLPEIKISQNELALDQGVGSTSLNVYATRNWTVSTTADWIAVNPSKGAAYSETKVTVTILENEGYNRVGTVKFDIGYDSKTLTIKQTGAQGEKSEGSGTVEDPYTVAGVLAFLETLGTTESENVVYVKGKVTAITEAFSAQYGNGTFTITDDGNGSSSPFTAYRVLYLGNKKWTVSNPALAEGDDVIVAGKVINYNGKTPETVQGTGYVYSHNGNTAGGGGAGDEAKGTGTLEDPYNPAGIAAAVANLTWTSTTDYQTTDPVYVKGKISKIAEKGTYTEGGTYGNATFYITETGEETGTEFYAYRILYLNNKKFASGQTDIKKGDEVVIYGKMMNFHGNTPETASGCYLYSLNGETGGGGGDEAKGTGTLTDPYNPAGAVAAVANLTWTSKTEYQTTEDVYVKGKISKIADKGTFTDGGTYGNASFYISETGEETGTQFYAFRILYLENKKFEAGQTDIKKGDEVIILGKLMNYQGNTPETVAGAAYLYSLNGATTAGGGTGGGGGSTDITTATIAQIIAAEVSDTKLYKLTATIKTVKNTTYGNLEVEDETGTLAVQGLTSKNEVGANDKSFSSLNLAAGDKITIVGVRQAYNDTPQLGSNNLACYFVEKVTGGGGGGSTDITTATIAQIIAAEVSDTKLYKLTATIKTVKNTTYGNLEVEDETGTLAVQGLTSKNEVGANDKSFSSLNLAAGDKITIVGVRQAYNDTPQLGSNNLACYFVEKVTGGGGGGGTGGGDTGNGITINLNNSLSWADQSDDTYGAGASATSDGFTVAAYKHTGGTAISATSGTFLQSDHIRVFKNSVFAITAPSGKKIKSLKITPSAASYLIDMTILEGAGTFTKGTATLDWAGDASKVVFHMTTGQVRMSKVEVVVE